MRLLSQCEITWHRLPNAMAKANTQFFGATAGVPNVPKDKYYSTLRGFIIGQLRLQQEEGV